MSYPNDQQAKELLIQVGRCLYASGMNTGIDGNFSCLVNEGKHLWTTASGNVGTGIKDYASDADVGADELLNRSTGMGVAPVWCAAWKL